MKFSENIKNGLNVVLNESSICELILNEKDNHLICKLELLRENGTEKPNYANFRLENIKRYIAAYRTDIQNENEILKFNPNQINIHLQNFINRDIYGWEFFNVENSNSNFNFSELSFEYLKDEILTNLLKSRIIFGIQYLKNKKSPQIIRHQFHIFLQKNQRNNDRHFTFFIKQSLNICSIDLRLCINHIFVL